MGERFATEAWIIRRVAERFGAHGSGVELGIGDDAAVLKSPPGLNQLVTTDTLIEGVHFDLSYMSLADVGYKALAVNLSDINAMGGESVAAVGTLGVPKGAAESDIDALLDGVEDALRMCSNAGQPCALIGGDTVVAPQWIVGFTVIGKVEGKPLLRSGAKPGDIIWHSGTLGLSGVGFERLRRGRAAASSAHVRPVPPLALGPWLQGGGYATAAQDLSDSLSQVALQLARASGVGIELDLRDYVFAAEVLEYATKTGASSVAEFLLAQAEDYELLFTTPPEFAHLMDDAPRGCTRLGRVVDAGEGDSYFDELGAQHDLTAIGFEHL